MRIYKIVKERRKVNLGRSKHNYHIVEIETGDIVETHPSYSDAKFMLNIRTERRKGV